MNFFKVISGILICFFALSLSAQTTADKKVKNHKFTLYGGVGPNVYFNNLVLGKKYVNELNYSFAGRFMWEPEHLLSLGIESGYYRLYSLSFGGQSDVIITNSAIPIQLVICMKFLKAFYFNFASGQSILINKVSNYNGGEINSSTLSLGDFAGSIGYRRELVNRVTLGAEFKFFYASKLNDKNLALLFMIGYNI
jgi:hypothetical protein